VTERTIGAPLRTLILDNQELIGDALARLLCVENGENSAEVVFCVDEALDKLRSDEEYDICIVDVFTPGMRGIETAVALQKEFPSCKFVLMSAEINSLDGMRVISGGLAGFIPKASISARGFIAALNLVHSGERFLPTSLIERVAVVQQQFSPREFEIIQRVRAGRTNKEIAIDLVLEENAIKTSLRTISNKLNARNRTEVALKAGVLDQFT